MTFFALDFGLQIVIFFAYCTYTLPLTQEMNRIAGFLFFGAPPYLAKKEKANTGNKLICARGIGQTIEFRPPKMSKCL